MSEINVDVGRNIVEIARQSGVPKFAARNIDGLVSYSVNDLPSNLPVRFSRPGLEASFTPIFALTMYADENQKNNLAVTDLVLQFATDAIHDHKAGQAFVNSLISKVAAKKWRRHIPSLCPAVSGRSSFLSIEETVHPFGACPVDPSFRIDSDDWISLAKSGITYEWLGDELVARLTVDTSEDSRGIRYRISLNYQNLSLRLMRDAKSQAAQLAKGDKAGWNSTSKHATKMIEIASEIKVLEANAVARGDSLVSRDGELPKK